MYCISFNRNIVMIKPLVIDEILLDVHLNGEFQCTVNQFSSLDLRIQITEGNIEGYSLKINPKFFRLFDDDDKIEEVIINISSDGEVDKWFPEYKLSDDYGYITVYGHTLASAIKLRGAKKKQKEKKENNG